METKDANNFCQWQPEPGWVILLPSRLEQVRGSLILPDSYTKKNNSGICIKVGHNVLEDLIDKECFFPTHSEYQVIDSDTGYLIYIVEANKIIMTRTPSAEVKRVSRQKREDLYFATLERSSNGN